MKRALRIALAITTLGVAGVLGVGSFSSAAGAQELDLCALLGAPYCPPGGSGSSSSVARGGTLTIRGEGFTPEEPVDVTLFSTPVPLGSFTADSKGVVEVKVTIPASTAPGAHTITMVGRTSGVEVVIPVTIVAATAAGGSRGGGLARTGSDVGPLAGIGLGLVAAGGAAAYATRRRGETVQPPSHLV